MRGGTWLCFIALALAPDDLLHLLESHHSHCCRLRDSLPTPCRTSRLLEVLVRPKLHSLRGRVLEVMLLRSCPSCAPAITAPSAICGCTPCSCVCKAGQHLVGKGSMSNSRGLVA